MVKSCKAVIAREAQRESEAAKASLSPRGGRILRGSDFAFTPRGSLLHSEKYGVQDTAGNGSRSMCGFRRGDAKEVAEEWRRRDDELAGGEGFILF